jgi:TetR/AcrR family transcriptional regulator, cholesterol catabolism regulator
MSNRVTPSRVTALLNDGKVLCTVINPDEERAETSLRDDPILDVVAHILETEGYDAVQLREVARRSKTSLATIYKRYANRDELIVAALQKWMEENRYSALSRQSHGPGESLYAGMMRIMRTIFEPWERHPGMLTAYFRAKAAPGGQEFLRRGLDIVMPAAFEVLGGVEDSFIADFETIISSVVYGLLGRFAAGEIESVEILPILDRAVFWLTSGYEARRDA